MTDNTHEATQTVEEWEEEFDERFAKDPVCKHGSTRGHYTCEPHDYPHVLGNRFGPDCETCDPPRKPTTEDQKRFIRTLLTKERTRLKEEVETYKEALENIRSVTRTDAERWGELETVERLVCTAHEALSKLGLTSKD